MKDIQFKFDQSTLPVGQPAVRHLIATLMAPDPVATTEAPQPLDLGIVLDVSTSMRGAPLEAAKRAAMGVVKSLKPHDRLTVVAFEDDVHVICETVLMDAMGQSQATEMIAGLPIGGCTNLSGGWLAAGSLVAAEAALNPGRRSHLVLLSDGAANRGIVDPTVLSEEAAGLLNSGVPTTCVGIGDHYCTDQLEAIADHGGGRLHDAETPEEIVEVLMGELGDLSELTAERVTLGVKLPVGVTAVDLAGGPTRREGSTLICQVGSMRAGVERKVVLRVEVEASVPDENLEFAVQLRWMAPGDAGLQRVKHTVRLERTDAPTKPAAMEDANAVAKAWEAGLVRQVTVLNRRHAYDEIAALQEVVMPELFSYVEQHPYLARVRKRILSLFRRAMRPIAERSRKEMKMLSMKGARAERDHRQLDRGEWHDHMDDSSM